MEASRTAPSNPNPNPSKDRITSHILDTTTGRPAAGVRAILSLIPSSSPTTPAVSFTGVTNQDGRIQTWQGPHGSEGLEATLAQSTAETGSSEWVVQYEVAEYFGGKDKTFYPYVAVTFRAEEGQKYHVPLLLSPFGYTTYRGS